MTIPRIEELEKKYLALFDAFDSYKNKMELDMQKIQRMEEALRE